MQQRINNLLDEWFSVLFVLTIIMASLAVGCYLSEKIPDDEKHHPIVYFMFVLLYPILMLLSLYSFPLPQEHEIKNKLFERPDAVVESPTPFPESHPTSEDGGYNPTSSTTPLACRRVNASINVPKTNNE